MLKCVFGQHGSVKDIKNGLQSARVEYEDDGEPWDCPNLLSTQEMECFLTGCADKCCGQLLDVSPVGSDSPNCDHAMRNS